jgi:hypothetical protein
LLPLPAGWGRHAVERQQQDPDSTLALVAAAVGLRRHLWERGVFTADDGGTWHVEAGNLLICERSTKFFVAVAMGTEPVRLPARTVLASAVPLETDGWLQPDNARVGAAGECGVRRVGSALLGGPVGDALRAFLFGEVLDASHDGPAHTVGVADTGESVS